MLGRAPYDGEKICEIRDLMFASDPMAQAEEPSTR